jgi:hypothetical protein
MKRHKFIHLAFFLFFSLPYLYGGCTVYFSSGSYNHKRHGQQPVPDEFTSVAEQARINSDNAAILAAGALLADLPAASSQWIPEQQTAEQSLVSGLRPLDFTRALGDSLFRLDFLTSSEIFHHDPVHTQIGDNIGNCGGTLLFNLIRNTTTGEFEANLSYHDYCHNGFTLKGEADVEGYYDVDSGKLLSASFYLENLSNGIRFMDTILSIDYSDTPFFVAINGAAVYTIAGQNHWFSDYSLNIYEFAGHSEIEVFGAYRHPIYGSVAITTAEPFIVHLEDQWPSSGKLVIAGYQNTKAELLALDSGGYLLEVNPDGNQAADAGPATSCFLRF